MEKIVRKRKWNSVELRKAVARRHSLRSVIKDLGLVPAGGNFDQIKKYIKELRIDSSHFTGKGWNKGMTNIGKPVYSLAEILVEDSIYQSYKLKKRLFKEGLKKSECEECGWKKISSDGRLPLELDHINGRRHDNRLSNLRVLCPNCHSLKPTHRGKNRNNARVA